MTTSPATDAARGGFPTKLTTALAEVWPRRFLPMPDRRERVNVIVAHNVLRSEIRQRAEVAGGAVSKNDLSAWVASVVRYTRATRSIVALRAIREAGSAYHLYPGENMKRVTSTAGRADPLPVPTAIQELRAALTPDLRHHLEQLGGRRLLDLFVLCRRLQAGDAQTALICHRALSREARRNLTAYGYLNAEWADWLRLVFNVLEEEGYEFTDGRWVRARVWAREAAHG